MEYTYQRNANLIKLLYKDNFAKNLCAEDKSYRTLRPVIESFYKDPDVYDMERICGRNILDAKTQLGLDGICGWKMLFDIHNGNPKWLEDIVEICENSEKIFNEDGCIFMGKV